MNTVGNLTKKALDKVVPARRRAIAATNIVATFLKKFGHIVMDDARNVLINSTPHHRTVRMQRMEITSGAFALQRIETFLTAALLPGRQSSAPLRPVDFKQAYRNRDFLTQCLVSFVFTLVIYQNLFIPSGLMGSLEWEQGKIWMI